MINPRDPAVTAMFLAAALAGCSSIPSLREQYDALDGPSKAIFLSYYPVLTPEQRISLVGVAAGQKASYIDAFLSTRGGAIERYPKSPANYTLTGLEIDPGQAEPISRGTSIPLHATVLYADGRKADVTSDSDWKVLPELARMRGSTLSFGCLASDVTVSANFLDEREGTRVIRVRKPLRSIELEVAGSSQGIAESEWIKLKLTARCEDGTSADVSCQADWSSQGTVGEVTGCGRFHVRSKEQLLRRQVRVSASYGGLTTERDLALPPRK